MWKVYVGNLDSQITERELADEFRTFGVVRSVWIARNPPGYAFVEFDDRRDADDAISSLDGKQGWRVEMSRNYGGGRSHGRNSSDIRCYDCGASGHFARECRSKGTRNSYRRSPSPRYRSSSRRYDSRLIPHDYSRSLDVTRGVPLRKIDGATEIERNFNLQIDEATPISILH